MRPPAIQIDIDPPKSITVPVAAGATGVNPETMRKWLQGGRVRLLVPRGRVGAWLRVSPVDTVRLAVLSHLIQFGFSVAEANAIVIENIDRFLEGIVLSLGDCPWPLLTNRLRRVVLNVSRGTNAVIKVSVNPAGKRIVSHPRAVLEIDVGWIAAETRIRVRQITGGAE